MDAERAPAPVGPPPAAPSEVRWLGRRPYAEVWAMMERLRQDRRAGRLGDLLLLLEHDPVITVGVQGSDGDEFPPGVPVVQVERGGKSTYHGPGQLVGYPIVDLDVRGRDIRRFVHDVEEMAIRTAGALGVSAGRVPGKRGVWVNGERKIASVGIAVKEWVSFHGYALNVSTDLAAFESFHPCGFDGRVMTSLSRELGRQVSVDEVRPAAIASWKEVFGASPPGAVRPPVPAGAAASSA